MAKENPSKATTVSKDIDIVMKSPPPSPTAESTESSPQSSSKARQHPQPQTFEQFYLAQCTTEFADSLDKIRQASDFKDESVPILIEALRQGADIYGESERERVMGVKSC
ncbi:MAG: hypothetical protein MMC33_006377 [Icmadophila ericetorum]|nr:hypothetical protein [Icmadophila ericetorum]